MVVNSVAEEHPLRIDQEILIFRAFAVSLIVCYNGLKHMPDRQVDLAILVPEYVAAVFCSLAQMIDIALLLQAEPLPARHLVLHDLEIRKFVNEVFVLFSTF